jgi:hypothetical protein
MIRNMAPFVCVIFLLGFTVNGFTQSKTTPKSKPAPTSIKPGTGKKEEVKEDQGPPVVNELENPAPTSLPPLPDVDTVAAPNDELTKEIKKLLSITNSMTAAVVVMKGTIESQRKNPNIQLPAEFYDRFMQAIDNGQVGGLLENAIIKIYRQKFNVEEIREATRFYETPIGKKIAAESAFIANSSRIEGEKIGQYVALKIIDGMMKEGKWK